MTAAHIEAIPFLTAELNLASVHDLFHPSLVGRAGNHLDLSWMSQNPSSRYRGRRCIIFLSQLSERLIQFREFILIADKDPFKETVLEW